MAEKKKTQPKVDVKHVGRPDMVELESKEPKVAIRQLAIHEANRALSELVHSSVMDKFYDFLKARTENWGNANVIKILIRFAEFRNEHMKEQEQGLEHKDNMGFLINKTRGMFVQTRESYLLDGAHSTQDVKKVERFIGVLEYLEAVNTGDAKKLVMMKEKHPHIATFVEKVILKTATETSKIFRTLALEAFDKLPFVAPETVMEVARLAELQIVSAIFNQHPDVASDERIPLTKGGISGAFKLHQERVEEAKRSFSMWQTTKDFWKSYWKFVKTKSFV